MQQAVLISASYDKQIRCWDVSTGRTIRCFTFQDSQVNAIHLVPETRYLAIAGFNVIRLYDMNDINCSHVIASQAVQQHQLGTTAPGSQTVTTPPPLFSSYESQGNTNFTSIGSFRLISKKPFAEEKNNPDNTIPNAEDSTFSTYEHGSIGSFDFSLAAVASGILEKEFKSGSDDRCIILYTTSEDGHIRFFDAKNPNTLPVLKDITTAAAVTCSCLSPDHRFLLTGSQIGQICVWHIPTIVSSITSEQEQRFETVSTEGGPFTDSISPGAQESAERTALISKFGRRPVHEFALEGDYTSVRSISIDPLARWFVVATSQGKLHFFRFAHDSLLYGTKSDRGQQVLNFCVSGHNTRMTLPRPSGTSHGVARDAGNSSLILYPPVASEPMNNPTSPQTIPRESIYRSALVINELNNHLRCSSDTNVAIGPHNSHGGNPQTDNHVNGTGMGAGLLDQLEHQQDSLSRKMFTTSGSPKKGVSCNDKAKITSQIGNSSPSPISSSAAATGALHLLIQKEMEFEEFYSFQAHYKYILKVNISPNAELLTTCCADYTVGRFAIPSFMRQVGRVNNNTSVQNSDVRGDSTRICTDQQRNVLQSDLIPMKNGSKNSDDAAKGENGDTINFEKVTEAVDVDSKAVSVEKVGDQTLQIDYQQADNRTEFTTEKSFSPLPATQNENSRQPESPRLRSGSETDDLNTLSADADLPDIMSLVDSKLSENRKDNYQKNENTICYNEKIQKFTVDVCFKPFLPLTDHSRWVWDCVFSECSQFLFTASSDCHIRMWNNLTSHRPQSIVFVGHTKPVTALLLAYNI